MRIDTNIKLDYDDVLLRPKRSTLESRKQVGLTRTFRFYHSPKSWEGIPIITANMPTCGTFEMANVLSTFQIITCFHKFYTLADYETFFKVFSNPDYICYSLGIRDQDFKLLKEMHMHSLLEHFSFICLDVPNGYINIFLKKLEEVRKLCPNHIIIAGNVVSNEITEELILNGADIVKVGIGPGGSCTTRRMTGVGYPQLSAVIECSDAAHGISNDQGCGLIIADGGQRYPSCVAKAFSAGADFNMFGQMFSGFEQSGGKTIEQGGKLYKEYYGSSSNTAMLRHYGEKAKHRASEGKYTLIPHKGDVHNFIQDLLGSLRSTGTYIGAKNLKEFSKRATFIQVNRQMSTYLDPYENKDELSF